MVNWWGAVGFTVPIPGQAGEDNAFLDITNSVTGAEARTEARAEATARKEKKAMEFIQKQRSMANSKHRDDNKQRQAAERQKKFGRVSIFNYACLQALLH